MTETERIESCTRCRRTFGAPPCGGPCPCPVSSGSFLAHVKADYCPHPEGPRFGDGKIPLNWKSVGLGDTIAKITTILRIPSCGGCRERQAKLNKATPYAESD
jgi:hypothetical protein